MKFETKFGIFLAGIGLLSLLTVFAGCSGKVGSAIVPRKPVIPVYTQGSAAAAIQERLFVQNTMEAIEKKQDVAFLGGSLAASLNVAAGMEPTGFKNYLENLDEFGDGLVLKYGPSLFGEIKQASDSESESALNSLSLLSALREMRINRMILGEMKTQEIFEQKLKAWGPQILSLAHRQYISGTREAFSFYFKRELEVRLNPEHLPSLRPDAEVRDLAAALPEDFESSRLMKRFLIEKDLNNPGISKKDFEKTLVHLQNSVIKDLQAARASVRELIGSPRLTDDEKKLSGGVVFHKLDATVGLAVLFMDKVLGKPEAARTFLCLAGNGIKIAKVLSQFKFAAIGANLASMNVIGAASDIISGLSGALGMGGPDVGEQRHEEVMTALKGIQQDISDLNNTMNQRFDEVDHRLVALSVQLDQGFRELLQQNTDIKVQLSKIQMSIRELTDKVDDLSFVTQQGFNDLMEQSFYKDYARCLGPDSLAALKYEEVTNQWIGDCLTGFSQRALENSRSGTRTGLGLDLSTSDAQLTALNTPHSETRLMVLSKIADKLNLRSSGAIRAVNVADWIGGASAYLRIKILFPTVSAGIRSDDSVINSVLSLGLAIRSNLQEMGKVETLLDIADAYEKDFNSLLSGKTEIPLETRATRLTVERKLLDQLLQITHPSDRFGRGRLGIVFGDDSYALPKGDQILSVIELEDSAVRNREIQNLRTRNQREMDVVTEYLRVERASGREWPISTMVDNTIQRIEIYAKSQALMN